MKKIKLNWQSVLLGMALCAVLFVFMGSMAGGPQTASSLGQYPELQQRLQYRTATATDVWEKCDLIDKKLESMEVKINRLREQMDYLLKNMEKMWRENRK